MKYESNDERAWLACESSLRQHSQNLQLGQLEEQYPGILRSTALATKKYLAILDLHHYDLAEPYLVSRPKDAA